MMKPGAIPVAQASGADLLDAETAPNGEVRPVQVALSVALSVVLGQVCTSQTT